ncbi:AraC family transcriptional regulator [Undibacterium parvum]|uniref:AraC family transcriptional regulator n=1 Tax=Undibacterium parvum TaxID=401471 RepID=A0A3Q9BRS7_9BURK|nr:helix-turn-helix domain-containing protein [Undibacterium parvum]AZP13053.1 AraC family transcriptional regulator [Undibacterium parvum]
MSIQIFPPHPKLAKLLMHILVLELDDCESYIPASLTSSVMLLVRGSVQVEQADGSLLSMQRCILRGPFNQMAHSFSGPKTLTISVGIRPGMLHQASGIFPATLLSSYLPMQQVTDPLRVETLLAAMDEPREIADYVALFQEFLLDTLDHQKKPSMGAQFLAAHQKMFSPLLDLSLYFGIGERQLERRMREAFGVNLRDARRVVRFGWSLLHIIGMPVGWGDLTRIAHDSGYYDQAHMHKEYLDLAGISPIALLQKIASDDPAYWLYRLSEQDTKKLFLPV